MFKKTITFIFILFMIFQAKAQEFSAFEKHQIRLEEQFFPFRLMLPENYDVNEKYPLIFFLHGYGERGDNNKLQLVHGAKFFQRGDVRKNYPAIVVFPQCPKDSYWSNSLGHIKPDGGYSFYFRTGGEPTKAMKSAEALLEMILNTYPVDKSRVYIGGLSMGGMGTFEMVRRNPGVFAAAFPICGGANPATAESMKAVSWWIFHGAKDNVVPPNLSEDMAKSLRAAGADVKFTLFPEANHNSWDPAFAEKDLLKWLFSKSLKE
jgi:predicted peptidase